MSAIDEILGRSATLPIGRFGPQGAFLTVKNQDDEAELLLLGSEIPQGAEVGDELYVFVYLDSEGRPLATTTEPKLKLHDVAFLEVMAETDFGMFLDWGLPKELLVPFAEQTRDIKVGERHPFGLYLDNSGRFAATMRVAEMVSEPNGQFEVDEWVDGEAWRNDPEIGLFVIVERGFVGLIPASEPHTLSRGDASSFRVSVVHDNGKIQLSLRGHGHEERENDAERLSAWLKRPTSGKLGDHSSPEEIRAALGISKKAFKRAAGQLLKERVITADENGIFRLRTQK